MYSKLNTAYQMKANAINITHLRLLCFMLVISLSNACFAELTSDLKDATIYQQKIIFLLSNTSENTVSQERDVFIARNFYYNKRNLLENIERSIVEDKANGFRLLDDFLSYTTDAQLRAADILTFMDVVDNLLGEHAEKPMFKAKHLRHLRQLKQKISIVQKTYKQDLADIYSAMGVRGAELEPWQDYIRFLQTTYERNRIYREFNLEAPALETPATRGATDKTSSSDLIWGYEIPHKTVVLTFDDGPHYRNTKAILDTLKQYDVKGYFFAVGQNIGEVRNGKTLLNKKSTLLLRAQSEGHILANHSFTHSVLTKLTKAEQEKELADTNILLKAVSGEETTVFRPPYGAKNDQLVGVSKDNGMRSVMWNIDSLDWGDPIPESIVTRVMTELEKKEKGILLFHDIHKQTVQALPLLLEQLKSKGYTVVTVDGKEFTDKNEVRVNKVKPVTKSQRYGNSWALVIGVNKYAYWPQLSYAVNDAKGIANLLASKYHFEQERILTLFDENATREKITHYLADVLSDPNKIKENDRVFIFYAGHGMTRILPSGRNLGYIIPVDAELDRFHSRSISMTHLQDFSEMIPAKHVYFVMDSCYSGIALTRSGGGASGSSKYLSEISSRRARQILTAGGAEQEVADGGPDGHSIFTWAFLDGLSGKADRDKNNVITASELGAYVSPLVSENSNQTPTFGNIVGNEGGEFLFELAVPTIEKTEPEPPQQLAAELLKLEQENAALKLRIANLQQPKDGLQQRENKQASQNRAKKTSSTYDLSTRKKIARNHHTKGLSYYKKKDYLNALSELRKAIDYNPANPTIVNDYGFVLYRNGEYKKALDWLEKTIELDAKRIPVYLNIADTLVELDRQKEAIPYYKYYLELYENSPLKDRIVEFLTNNPSS